MTAARVLGAMIVLLAVLPLHALLDDPRTGLAGAATTRIANLNVTTIWFGALLAMLPAVLLARADARHRLWHRSRAGFSHCCTPRLSTAACRS